MPPILLLALSKAKFKKKNKNKKSHKLAKFLKNNNPAPNVNTFTVKVYFPFVAIN